MSFQSTAVKTARIPVSAPARTAAGITIKPVGVVNEEFMQFEIDPWGCMGQRNMCVWEAPRHAVAVGTRSVRHGLKARGRQ